MGETKTAFTSVYRRLLNNFGPQNWWPARTRFEIIVGAILTQNTNWSNVEKALRNLKQKKLLTPQALKNIPTQKLSQLIRPSGAFNVKAKRLKNFLSLMFREYGGNLKAMGAEDREPLRKKLLSVNGIGPETADSILLYAFDKPVFVVDAYTKRIFSRHNLISPDDTYHEIQETFMSALENDPALFNEYHALIVKCGKEFCKPNPKCEECALNTFWYSLKEKCFSCHRALPEKQDRKMVKDGYLCRKCAIIS